MKKLIAIVGILIFIFSGVANAATVKLECGDPNVGISPTGEVVCPGGFTPKIFVTTFIDNVAASDNMDTVSVEIGYDNSKLSPGNSGKWPLGDFMESNGASSVVGAVDSGTSFETINSITGDNPATTPFGSGYSGFYDFSCTTGQVISCNPGGDLNIIDNRVVEATKTWWAMGNLASGGVKTLFEEPGCVTDGDCDALDRLDCDGDNVVQIQGVCDNGNCIDGTPSVQTDCNSQNFVKCVGTVRTNVDHTCNAGVCVADAESTIEDCNNGQWCDGLETCTPAQCVAGTPPDCSDANDCTADNCNEQNDQCENPPLQAGTQCGQPRDCPDDQCNGPFGEFYPVDGHDTCDGSGNCVEYDCSLDDSYCCDNDSGDGVNGLNCNAECDQDLDCRSFCDGNFYNFDGECDLNNLCECQYDTINCDDDDGWYDEGSTQWVNDQECTEKEQKYQDYRDYTCGTNGCEFSVTNNQWVDTGSTRNKPDTTSCEDGDFCTFGDACFSGVCSSGKDRDCSDGVDCTDDSCNESTDSCDHTPNNANCDNGLNCDGAETCHLTNDCQAGTPIDCSGSDVSAIATCNNNPDNNPLTWDFRSAFQSTCVEPGTCTQGNLTITFTCDVSGCGAECDAQNPCANTECDQLDGCQGNDYYDYADQANNCLGNCTCEQKTCTSPTVTQNDPRCTQCQTDDDCNSLDRDYCDGDVVKHDEGECVNFACEIQTRTIQDCNSLDNDYCSGTNVDRDDYSCSAGACTSTTTTIQNCDNGLWCDGTHGCNAAQCYLISSPDCDDRVGCTDDSCNEATDSCDNDADDANCDDGLWCNGAETCDAVNDCQAGVAPDCDDNVGCTDDSCNEGTDSCDNDADDANCDNGKNCDGAETCDAVNDCQAGTPIDCSGSDIAGVDTCNNNPDNNPFTYDFRSAFTSVCQEPGTCTTGDPTITHTCNFRDCNADCEIDDDCPETNCDHLDGCVGNDYYDYVDQSNNCLNSCTCENNQCVAPQPILNDPRCIECTTDAECNGLDRDYCEDDKVKHDEGVCIDFSCEVTTTVNSDCNAQDQTYCSGTEIRFDDWVCNDYTPSDVDTDIIVLGPICELGSTTTQQDCDDGLACNGQETCNAAQCVQGNPIDCSGNDLAGIGTCDNDPDDNPLTWDFRAAFTSVCEEPGTCTQGNPNVNSECDVAQCNAECDANTPCEDTDCDNLDGCAGPEGKDWHDYSDVGNACLGDCTCEDNQCGAPTITPNHPSCTECQVDADCDVLDDSYCDGTTIKDVEGKCINFECEAITTPRLDCDDNLACNGQELCINAQCVQGNPVDCSPNDIPGIATCDNDPDNDPLTWDFRQAFQSQCQEPTGQCTTGDPTIDHQLSFDCGAECIVDEDCPVDPDSCQDLDGDGILNDYVDNPDTTPCNEGVCAAYQSVITKDDVRCKSGELKVPLPGWISMFSIPVIPDNPITFKAISDECQLAVEDGIAFWDADINGYIFITENDILFPGQGYFINLVDECEFHVEGYPFTMDYVGYLGTRQLKDGWNMIGGSDQQIPDFDAVEGNCLITSGPWGFDTLLDEYFRTQILDPGKGFWVKANGVCQLG